VSGPGLQSPVKVDHNMRTNVGGLWAIGDTSYAGSAWAGAIGGPPGRMWGTGLMNVLLSVSRASPDATKFALTADDPLLDEEAVKSFKEHTFAPLRRKNGLSPISIIRNLQETVVPVKYNALKSKARLEEALSRVADVQQQLLEMVAKDPHELRNCHQAESMAMCAEMTFRAALARTESRGFHFREDYPMRDDKNWLKWIIVKQDSRNKMAISTEPIPIEKYKVKP
jgi:succinate dehydrogenase / fumarate reductase flavoprotein subunit